MKTKLVGWQAKQLSMVGRITLYRTVIQSLPVYSKVVLNEIEKIERSFIWDYQIEKRRYHVI